MMWPQNNKVREAGALSPGYAPSASVQSKPSAGKQGPASAACLSAQYDVQRLVVDFLDERTLLQFAAVSRTSRLAVEACFRSRRQALAPHTQPVAEPSALALAAPMELVSPFSKQAYALAIAASIVAPGALLGSVCVATSASAKSVAVASIMYLATASAWAACFTFSKANPYFVGASLRRRAQKRAHMQVFLQSLIRTPPSELGPGKPTFLAAFVREHTEAEVFAKNIELAVRRRTSSDYIASWLRACLTPTLADKLEPALVAALQCGGPSYADTARLLLTRAGTLRSDAFLQVVAGTEIDLWLLADMFKQSSCLPRFDHLETVVRKADRDAGRKLALFLQQFARLTEGYAANRDADPKQSAADQLRALVNKRTSAGESLLYLSLQQLQPNACALMAVLIAAGADVNGRQSDKGWSPLHCAAAKGYEGAAALLQAHGADLFAQDERGSSPQLLALWHSLHNAMH